MMKKTFSLIIALLLVSCVVIAVVGCGNNEAGVEESSSNGESRETSERSSGEADPSRTVVMNGRSVMEGWMEHWGYDWEGPVEKNGFFLDYKELDASDIAPSFTRNVEGLPPGTVVFFKYCFADFDGSNLSQLKQGVNEAIQAAKAGGLKLIIGNALPVRKQDGVPEMLPEYRKYNQFLEQAAQDPDVWVYDFYGILAGGNGWLKPEYQTDDSHPNQDAYTALDPSFFELLNTVFAERGGGG
jgi:predicted small secreted protein